MDSIKEQILGHLSTSIAGILKTSGYENAIRSVQRVMGTGQTTEQLPVVLMEEGNESVKDEPLGFFTKHLVVSLDVLSALPYHPGRYSAAAAANSLEADLEKAIFADRTRGGKAIDTFYDGREAIREMEGEGAFSFRMNLRVHYRHQPGNPYSLS